MKKITATALLLATIVLAIGWWLDQQSNVSRFLPSEASEINEAFFGTIDYAKYLRAKVSEDGFHIFRKRIGYTEDDLIVADSKNNFGWGSGFDKVGEWWDPSLETIGSYGQYDEEDGSMGLLKYENGYVYHMYQKW